MPLKKLLFAACFLFCCLLSCINCCCQDSTHTFFKKIKPEIAPRAYIFFPVPYKVSSVTIVDNRTDTSRIGLFEDFLDQDAAAYLHQNETLQGIFDSLLVDGSNPVNLKIILNHFFITNPPLNGSTQHPALIGFRYPCVLTINAKVYIQQDGYWQGLFKADTAIIINDKLESNFRDLLYEAGLYFSRKIETSIAENAFVNHPKLSDALIDSINKPVAPMALREQDSVGLFKTFNDFLTGKLTPANINLEQIQKGIYAAYMIDGNKNTILLNDTWGVVKNGKTYILRQRMAYPLIKEGASYYWMEVYRYKNKGAWIPAVIPLGGGSFVYGVDALSDKIKFLLKPCMLNMQTGDGH